MANYGLLLKLGAIKNHNLEDANRTRDANFSAHHNNPPPRGTSRTSSPVRNGSPASKKFKAGNTKENSISESSEKKPTNQRTQNREYPDYAALQRDHQRAEKAKVLGTYLAKVRQQRDQRAKKAQELGRDAYTTNLCEQQDRAARALGFTNDAARRRARRALAKQQKQKATQQNIVYEM